MGLSLNVSKCEVITSHHIDLSSHMALEGFVHVDIRDASLLGSPLLADRCLDKMPDDKCKELQLMMSRVQQLNSHYALTIIRNSMGVPKLMHMLRTSRCIEYPKLSQFDNIMQSGLESILNVELSVNQWKQACLPIRDGGLGIRTATSLAPSAFLSSAVSSCDLQLEILPMLAGAPDTDFTDNSTFWTTLTSGQPNTGSGANNQPSWDKLYVDMVKTNLLSDCTNDLDHARLLAAFDQHSADWLHALPLSSCGLFLDNEAIRISVALRLGATMCLPHDCQCGVDKQLTLSDYNASLA